MPFDRSEYPGGTEIRILISPLTKEIVKIVLVLAYVAILTAIYIMVD